MKLICDGLDLSDALSKVSKAIATKSINPILEGIKLAAKNDKLVLTATDTELTIEKTIDADVNIEGEIIVPGKLFNDFVRKLSNEKIKLSVSDDKLKIEYAGNEGHISTMDLGEYPLVNKITDGNCFSVPLKEFKEAVSGVIFCVSQDDSRPVLKGCLLEKIQGELTFVALDGFRLAMTKCIADIASKDEKIIVPAKTLSEALKMFGEQDEMVHLRVNKNQMQIEVKNLVIITRLIDGEFINYKQIIPKEYNTDIVVGSEKLCDALERAMVMSGGDKNKLIKFDIKERCLTITSNSEVGNIKEKIEIETNGKDVRIAFNSKYFSEALRAISEKSIKVMFQSPTTPCVIMPTKDEKFLYLILPVRINE